MELQIKIKNISHIRKNEMQDKIKEQEYFEEDVRATCNDIANMLVEKNLSYGNSALEPVRIFSKSEADEGLNVRIDDKLNRILKGRSFAGDNDIIDLIGYLVLKLVYNKRNRPKELISPQNPTNR